MAAVLFEKRDQVAWITLNRPEAKNTMNAAVFVGLRDAWSAVRSDDDIRVAVFTATGDEDFCCGGDLGSVIPLWTGAKQPETDEERELVGDPAISNKVLFRGDSADFFKPVVAAVNGRALGGGFEMLLNTDVRIAVPHAVFGLPEPKAGVVPGGGSMVRLARQISYANAMKIMLTAEPITAEEALRIGLISEVVAADALLERAEELAARIAANAPLAMTAIKRTVLESHTEAWPEAFAIENAQSRVVMGSEDAREGPRAFKEKRAPNFLGR